jgi:anti-sigma B factor antagonist
MDDLDPALALTRTAYPQAQVIHVAGILDYLHAPMFRVQVDAALRNNPLDLILELSGVQLCDSSGLSELIDARRQAEAAKVRLMLAAVPANLSRQLTITGLAAVFDSYPTLADALRQDRPPTRSS